MDASFGEFDVVATVEPSKVGPRVTAVVEALSLGKLDGLDVNTDGVEGGDDETATVEALFGVSVGSVVVDSGVKVIVEVSAETEVAA